MVKVIILSQIHSYINLARALIPARKQTDLNIEEQSFLEKIAKSQFLTAQFIAKAHQINPAIPVIVENQKEALGTSELDLKFQEGAKTLFPNGLPHSYEDLDFQQKRFIVLTSQCGTLYVNIGICKKTYSDDLFYINNKEAFDKKYDLPTINHNVSQKTLVYFGKNYPALCQKREYNTFKNGIQTANELNQDTVIIVYGGIHPFTDVATCFPNAELITVDCTGGTIDYKEAKMKFYEDRPPINMTNLDSLWGLPPTKSFCTNIYDYAASAMTLFNCCKGKREKHKNIISESKLTIKIQ